MHLTAYGLPLTKMVQEIREANKDILVIVGSEKMPGEIFKLADWNISVTNQPMSEVAALAIFLDWYEERREFDQVFSEAQIRIIPSKDRREIQQISS